MTPNQIELNVLGLTILAKLKTGNAHQILINSETETMILMLINKIEGKIRIIDEPIKGVYIERGECSGVKFLEDLP